MEKPGQEEILGTVSGSLVKKNVVIWDEAAIGQLNERGYGEREDDTTYILKDYEALYLLQNGKLEIRYRGKSLAFDDLVRHALRKDPDAWTRFLVYRDLRVRGYVGKEGFGFGIDLRVYDRGDYGSKSAKYVVFVLDEGTELSVEGLKGTVSQISRMGKVPIIAVIERRGEVIYYHVAEMRLELRALG